MSRNLTYFLLPIVALLFCACKPKYTKEEFSKGEINLTRVVMIGDGNTAGYMDDALYSIGQENSLGTILQGHLSLFGAAEPIVPWMGASNIGINWMNQSRLILSYKTDCKGISALSPIRYAVQGEQGAFTTSAYNALNKISNWGIPGLRMLDLSSNLLGNSQMPNYNPYFARMSKDQLNSSPPLGTSSVLDNIFDGAPPTFCSIFLGIEDFLPYAKSGATSSPMSPLAGLPGQGFDESLNTLLDQLSSQGAQGVIATLPMINQLPYFTTIAYNGLTLSAENAASLNQIYNPLGYNFIEGDNPFMIEDPSAGAFGVRPMQEGELLLLSIPLDSVRCHQMGSVYPFRNEFILTAEEVQEINNRISLYNQSIRQWANYFGFAIAETSEFYSNLNDGFTYNGVSMSTKFVTGGVFSLDAIHLNGRGNALLCNVFITAINNKYKSKIPLVNPLIYSSIFFP